MFWKEEVESGYRLWIPEEDLTIKTDLMRLQIKLIQRDMATIHKKVWREYFEEIISGKKKFELRLADFEINKGDTLILEEYDKDKKEYTGRKFEVIATYILKTKGQTFWPPEEVEKHGFQIIQFEPKSGK